MEAAGKLKRLQEEFLVAVVAALVIVVVIVTLAVSAAAGVVVLLVVVMLSIHVVVSSSADTVCQKWHVRMFEAISKFTQSSMSPLLKTQNTTRYRTYKMDSSSTTSN